MALGAINGANITAGAINGAPTSISGARLTKTQAPQTLAGYGESSITGGLSLTQSGNAVIALVDVWDGTIESHAALHQAGNTLVSASGIRLSRHPVAHLLVRH